MREAGLPGMEQHARSCVVTTCPITPGMYPSPSLGGAAVPWADQVTHPQLWATPGAPPGRGGGHNPPARGPDPCFLPVCSVALGLWNVCTFSRGACELWGMAVHAEQSWAWRARSGACLGGPPVGFGVMVWHSTLRRPRGQAAVGTRERSVHQRLGAAGARLHAPRAHALPGPPT